MPPALKGTQAPMIHPAQPQAQAAPPEPVQMPTGSAEPLAMPQQAGGKPLVFGPVGQVAPGTMAPKGTLTGDEQAREQLETLLRDHQQESARDICNAVMDYAVVQDALLRQQGDEALIDDKTVFIVKRTE